MIIEWNRQPKDETLRLAWVYLRERYPDMTEQEFEQMLNFIEKKRETRIMSNPINGGRL